MAIAGVGASSSPSASTSADSGPSAASSAGQLQSTFLQLLLKQMQNQDPFSPMDNTQFVQQLATFANLEQLQGLNDRMQQSLGLADTLGQLTGTMNDNMAQTLNAAMMNLVGKRVAVPGNAMQVSVDPKTQEPVVGRVLVRSPSPGTVTAVVRDDQGKIVKDLGEITLTAGFTPIRWDGRDKDNVAVPPGRYTVQVTDSQQKDMGSALFSSGIVEAVQFDTGFTRLVVGGKTFLPNQVVEVGLPDGA
jgi:flagellar basal-body rod modification protein FlgD